MIEFQQISKSFNKRQVLFDISGSFEKGKTNLILVQVVQVRVFYSKI